MAHHFNHSSQSILSILYLYVRVLFDAWRSTKAQSLLRFHLNFMRIASEPFFCCCRRCCSFHFWICELSFTTSHRQYSCLRPIYPTRKIHTIWELRHFSVFSTKYIVRHIRVFLCSCVRCTSTVYSLHVLSSLSAVVLRHGKLLLGNNTVCRRKMFHLIGSDCLHRIRLVQ